MNTPFPPIRLDSQTRLRRLQHLQPKAVTADVPPGLPVDLVVLATKTTGATCRLHGREGVLTLRTSLGPDLIPGRILTVKPDRVWAYLSLGPNSEGVLPWGCLGNRPFLRCLHGFGLCLWRLGFFTEARRVFERMLWMNPSDNQGVRFVLPEVRAKRVWEDFAAEEEGGH